MATTITEITECFEYFFSSLYRREFVKTLRLNECSERELLPLVRCYLLGWFADNVSPEVKSKLPGTVSGHGYIDFVIDDVAVEFAVRKPTAARSNVSATVNSTEVKKLMKWFTEFGHLNRGDMLTSEQHRCHNEKKKFQRRV